MNVSGKMQGKDIVAPAWSLHSTNYFTKTAEHTFIFLQTLVHRRAQDIKGVTDFYQL